MDDDSKKTGKKVNGVKRPVKSDVTQKPETRRLNDEDADIIANEIFGKAPAKPQKTAGPESTGRPVRTSEGGERIRKAGSEAGVRNNSSGSTVRTARETETADRVRRSANPVSAGKTAAGSAARRPAGSPDTVRSAGSYDGAGRRPSGGSGSGPRRPSGGSGNGPKGPDDGRPRKTISPEEKRRREYLKLKKEREKKRNIVLSICGVLIFALIVLGIVLTLKKGNKDVIDSGTKTVENGSNENVTITVAATNTPTPTSTPMPSPTPAPVSATLVAVGDDLVHQGVYKSGFQADGTRNYDHLFAQTKYLMEDADIAVMNQETIFGPAQGNNDLKSYPSFNSPQEIGDALVKAGFNVITHATNHAYDVGIDGLLYTVKYWKEKHPEVLVLGIYETAEEQAEIPIMEVNGIKFAMLNYTYSHNWSTLAKPAEGHLNMLCPWDPESRAIDFNSLNPQVIEDIKKAEELADFTIVFPHWGTEYVNDHTAVQESMAKQMTEAGADLIIGTHPHVIEPVVWITSDNGNRSLCYYSLGNYTSTQDEVPRLLGGMAKLTITKDSTGTYIEENTAKAIPLVTHYEGSGNLAKGTYSLAKYTDDMAANHGLYIRKGRAAKYKVTVEYFQKHSQEVFGEFCSIE